MLSRTFGDNDEVSLRWSRRPIAETIAELAAHQAPPVRVAAEDVAAEDVAAADVAAEDRGER